MKKEDFILQVEPLVEETHFVNQGVKTLDTLTVGSMEYEHIKSKPARYTSLLDNELDIVFSYKRNLSIDRAVLLRTIDDITENGWYYEEMVLLCDSLGFELTIVSITEQGYNDYINRIQNGEILSSQGDPLTKPVPFPKVFFDNKQIKKSKKLYRTFGKWKLCPDCGSNLDLKKSKQASYKDKNIYVCSNDSCEFYTVLPK